ncbi:antA/AntB antirepressor family protein [Bartonella krasnovii]|uniref:antA/AntB antirepressor family protein n=1 Tax=Bartonella krasnovii TaxID=2267275 RepID=UPI001F4D0710|nr:antA/AntB antirepressor family protein [Bartonella krasnovii]UNF39132.1 antA/AntB antirepressor family protein [Bartonella krasnovii]UNF50673.1 antA/AntB antirepressor family protein [Bartonella krasnovii]
MEKLIAIQHNTIKNETVQTVNARELHAFLEVNSNFRDWIKNRIKEYNFQENQDFIIFAKILAKSLRGRPSMEYHLTLDMAKELSMLERNEKGKQARQYFIECEKRAKKPLDLANALENPLFVKKLLLESVTQLETLKSEVSTLKPKAMALESLQRHNGLFGLTEAAKMLEMQPKQFIQFLQQKGWVYRRAAGGNLLPYQDKIQKQLMDCPTITLQTASGIEKVIPCAKITTKGMGLLSQELKRQSMH